jgi:tetratricopeptide (TPR) repeat protein
MNNTSGYKTNVRPEIWISLFLVISTLAVYWQVSGYEFVRYDDHRYVYENRNVKQGLTLKNMIWAFTSLDVSNWHPITWLSYISDYHFYGLNAGSYHLTSVLIHILNSLLIFIIFRKLIDSLWQSAFISALFALHPLHVESVAWISERKDVLSMFFWMLTIWAYLRYVREPKLGSYLLVISGFVCGLMSKAMVVTLPCVLLLLDYHPLQRKYDFKLFIEKIPLFILSLIDGIITIIAQKEGGAVGDPLVYPFGYRIANAALSYVLYLWKTVFPFDLAIFYPHPESIPLWQSAGALLFLASVTIVAVRLAKSYPFLIVGWLWYLGTLIPVIGILQVGDQAMADRYTYIPHIGVFIMLSCGLPYLIKQKIVLNLAAYGFLIFCMVLTYFQIGHWKNTVTLFEHAANVTENNFIAHSNLGNFYAIERKADKALPHLLKALEIKPYDLETINQLGNLFANAGNLKKAAYYFAQAVRLAPNDAGILYKFGTMLMDMGIIDKAIRQFSDAVRLKPNYAEAHNDLGVAMMKKDDIDSAIRHFSIALRLKPDDADIRNNFERASAMKNQK